MNYLKDVHIDETALDVEWLNQPKLAMEYGENWAKAAQALSKAEENLKLVQANLRDAINQNSDKFLGEGVKLTIDNVNSCILRHDDYIEAKKEVSDRQYELDIAQIAKNEIGNSRKSALENLVKLYQSNYFAAPKVPRDLSYEASRRAAQKRTNEGIANKMKRSK